jgi:sterol 3beta-glucosyltransferase
MRIAIQALGTRGDVQPYVALALGLLSDGHDVQLAGPMQFETMARERGVPFAPLPGEFLELINTPEGKAAMASGPAGFGAGLKLLKYIRPLMRKLLDAEWLAVRDFQPDVIVHHPKSIASPHMAEKLGRPFILASPLPGFTPTSAFPTPLLPFANLGPFNRASHGLATNASNVLFRRLLSDWRATTLGMPGSPAKRLRARGTIYAYSPSVLAKPADWNEDVLVSGYWFLDTPAWEPDDDLRAFIQSGSPPVYIGFGSMPELDAEHVTKICIEALEKTGKRGLLATGGGALAAVHGVSHVRSISGAPHDRLFPHLSATIHHGGAGTTGASLRAGKPTVACPFFGDQPFWARRIAQLGVGPPPLDRKRLTASALAEAIVAMDAPDVRRQAAMIGAAIRDEGGVPAAVAFIRKTIEGSWP